jgi:hypothetical protein
MYIKGSVKFEAFGASEHNLTQLGGYAASIVYYQNMAIGASETSSTKDKSKTNDIHISKPIYKQVDITDARFIFEIDEQTLDMSRAITVSILEPNGSGIAQKSLLREQLNQEIVFNIKENKPLQPNADNVIIKPAIKLSGRIIDLEGKQQVKNVNVMLFGRLEESENFQLLTSSQTDTQGYFSTNYPDDVFAEAYGMIGVEGNPKVPIALEQQKFPKKIILATQLPEAKAEDEECASCNKMQASNVPRTPDVEDFINAPHTYSNDLGGGTCVDFTAPNRTLEEFSFYHVVRTTEPQIKGLSVRDKYIPLDKLVSLVGQPATSMFASTQSASTASSTPKDRMMMANIAGMQTQQTEENFAHNFIHNQQATFMQKGIAIDAMKEISADPDQFSLENLMSTQRFSAFKQLSDLTEMFRKPAGRTVLNAEHEIDWDDEPTFYQATTIAHGHILHFKQVWKADGYSMGDLLYSLPLAPCQKKQIAIVDWSRSETSARTEQSLATEALQNDLSRDRDIGEVVNSSLNESLRGGSEASTWAAGGGLGLAIGPLIIGGGGGGGGASSSAWQNSSRNLAANSLQQLRDRTSQSASSVRSQRSTVVQAVNQHETMRVQTEVVANHNHCHAITIEYFEVLRHFMVEQRLADVQECLFVPLLMSKFNAAKALRWRDILQRYLRKYKLSKGFDALERIRNNYEGSDLPLQRYADESIEYMDGELTLEFRLSRPNDGVNNLLDTFGWTHFSNLIGWGIITQTLSNIIQADRDNVFQRQLAPRIAEEFVQKLRFFLVTSDGSEIEVKLDATLVANYIPDRPLLISIRPLNAIPYILRRDVTRLKITCDAPLPVYSKVIMHSATIRYRSPHMSNYLCKDCYVKNDLLPGDPVVIPTFLNSQELRNPRQEDKEVSKQLVAHLNEHIEYYHRAIWWAMDKERRYMLLDGFIAPHSGGRSVASVVDNRLIGIMGNCLVMPVAPGFKLDPTYRQDAEKPIDLFAHYQPTTPIAPLRISLPTRGVYAESVMGACNSCEEKDDTRFWRFEESPCGDEPTAIQMPSTDSRRSDPPNLQAKDFPNPMINIQNAPNAPDPSGLAAALGVLGKADLFRDITGLDQNQKNALAAFQTAMSTANTFGNYGLQRQQQLMSSSDKNFKAIKQAQKEGLINEPQAQDLAQQALRGMIGQSGPNVSDLQHIQSAVSSGLITPAQGSSLANDLLKGITSPPQPTSSLGSGSSSSLDTSTQHAERDPFTNGTVSDLLYQSQASGDHIMRLNDGDRSLEIQPVSYGGIPPVSDSTRWADLIRFSVPATIVTALTARNMHVQTLESANYLSELNLDLYPILITTAPTFSGSSSPCTPSELLKHIRLHINDFVNTSYASFKKYDNTLDAAWDTASPLGAVINIDIGGPDNASVVVSQSTTTKWLFSTIHAPNTGDHPVSGQREFGIATLDNGNMVVYTRGADRTTGVLETIGGGFVPGDVTGIGNLSPFGAADRLWQSFQAKVVAFVNANGGVAAVQSRYSRRHNWRMVKRYLSIGGGSGTTI